jgi:uroporphyrin-III C-methyltransferase
MDFPGLVGPRFDPGSVWLVGAGPGDPGLLTLHAAFALGQADVVVHDALVSAAILSLAPCAELEMAGKRAGGIRTQQLRINNRLIQLARQGLRVVRLKGGDPLVFGRGGEEALALAAAGIAFRIVPGISAGIGGTAAAGIPLTHRRLARSVAFATGHDSSGDLADVDWHALARGSEVLVFYMAQRRIGQIAERLIEAGRDKSEPVALISNASCPDQDVRISTLATAGADVAGIPAGAATLIVVGPVIALRPLLADWQQIEPMTIDVRSAAAPARATG